MKDNDRNGPSSFATQGRSREIGPLDLWRESPDNFSLGGIWLFFRRNWLRILLVWLLVSALAFAAAYFLMKKYSATAVLLVDPRAARITRSGGVISNIGNDAIAVESLVQATRTEGFLGSLVDELNLTQDPFFAGKGETPEKRRLATIEKLNSKLTVARRGATYVIDITMVTPSGELSARIANAVAKKILNGEISLRSGISATTAKEIEGRLAELQGRVSRAEEAAAKLKARLKVTAAGEGTTLLERRVSELNAQYVLSGAQTAEARARYELLRKAGASAGDNLPQSAQSSVLNALRGDYARLSRQAADQSTVLGPRHPQVISLNAQIADTRRQINAEISRMMLAARSQFLEAQQREAELSRQLKATQTETGELGPEMVKLAELEREAKAERGVYEELLNRQRELMQVKDLEPSDIRFVSEALPSTATTPTRTTLLIGSLALGMICGLCYALLRELMNATLRTAAQAERLGNVERVGFVPRLRARSRKESDGAPDLTPWLGDLCAELKPPAQDDGYVILVTSAHRGEGRSTIAANLASFYGEGGDRVLLIEADRPARRARDSYGLLDVLESGEDLRSALIERADAGYTLLPFGGDKSSHAAVAALMSGVTLRAMLRLARQWFDVVIIDGPPALEAAHARQLATQVDQAVFLTEWDKTSAADADAALERLNLSEVALLYNKVDPARLRLYDPAQSRLMSRQAPELADAA